MPLWPDMESPEEPPEPEPEPIPQRQRVTFGRTACCGALDMGWVRPFQCVCQYKEWKREQHGR